METVDSVDIIYEDVVDISEKLLGNTTTPMITVGEIMEEDIYFQPTPGSSALQEN